MIRLIRHLRRPPHIDAGQAPGGLVFRVTRDDRIIWWETVYPNHDLRPFDTGNRQADILNDSYPCTAHLFDGDTGQCIASYTRTRWRSGWARELMP